MKILLKILTTTLAFIWHPVNLGSESLLPKRRLLIQELQQEHVIYIYELFR